MRLINVNLKYIQNEMDPFVIVEVFRDARTGGSEQYDMIQSALKCSQRETLEDVLGIICQT